MTLFLLEWKIMDQSRVPCFTYFGSMTPADDAAESPGVVMLGRWSNVGNASGACICRADSYVAVSSWIYNWAPMADISIKPICDDNVARKIISGGEPEYQVDYSHVGDEPEDGETLYMIHYKFHQDKKMDGYRAFAGLTQEQDESDSGACRPLGRWHDIGGGCGMAIAGARSEEDIFKWAFNWTEICDCQVVPVLTDKQSRAVIKGKPDFEQKLEQVKKSMAPPSKIGLCC